MLTRNENPHINGRHRVRYVYFILQTHRAKYAREQEDVFITSDPANVLYYFLLTGVWKHFFKKLLATKHVLMHMLRGSSIFFFFGKSQ